MRAFLSFSFAENPQHSPSLTREPGRSKSHKTIEAGKEENGSKPKDAGRLQVRSGEARSMPLPKTGQEIVVCSVSP